MRYYFFGFSYWKHRFIKPFFSEEEQKKIVFINPVFKKNYFKLACKKGLNEKSTIYIWGRKSFPLVEEYAKNNNLTLYRVEDGFIRSVGLGSDLTQPYSLVIDSKGIYFDATQESDLEHILNNRTFSAEELTRAKKLTRYLIKNKLSKYNIHNFKELHIVDKARVVFVPGQVEDDASIQYGGAGMSNLELLKKARENAQDAYIIFKPHPDVLAGNRVGSIAVDKVLRYADEIVTDISLDSVLSICHEVHTITSLVGFEALMRGKKVYTYGMPFYAGWGLSIDAKKVSRRTRILTLDELVAATLLVYPHYIHPVTLKPCEVEDLVVEIEKEKRLYSSSKMYNNRVKIRNFFSRKLQFLLRLMSFNGWK